MHTFNAMVTLQVKCLGNVGLRVGVKVKKKSAIGTQNPVGVQREPKRKTCWFPLQASPLLAI